MTAADNHRKFLYRCRSRLSDRRLRHRYGTGQGATGQRLFPRSLRLVGHASITEGLVAENQESGQIPAEYSRLFGEDIFLAGSLDKDTPALVMKAEAVALPTQAQILARAGLAEECADALLAVAEEMGPGGNGTELSWFSDTKSPRI